MATIPEGPSIPRPDQRRTQPTHTLETGPSPPSKVTARPWTACMSIWSKAPTTPTNACSLHQITVREQNEPRLRSLDPQEVGNNAFRAQAGHGTQGETLAAEPVPTASIDAMNGRNKHARQTPRRFSRSPSFMPHRHTWHRAKHQEQADLSTLEHILIAKTPTRSAR